MPAAVARDFVEKQRCEANIIWAIKAVRIFSLTH